MRSGKLRKNYWGFLNGVSRRILRIRRAVHHAGLKVLSSWGQGPSISNGESMARLGRKAGSQRERSCSQPEQTCQKRFCVGSNRSPRHPAMAGTAGFAGLRLNGMRLAPCVSAEFRHVPGADYATLWFTLASAKQRPGTSIGGLQSVLNFGFGVICAGTCTGALSLAWGFPCLIGNLSVLIERWAIC